MSYLLAVVPGTASAAPPPTGAPGAVDSTFGTSGHATITVSGLNLVQATKVLSQQDGKIIVAGLQPGTQGSAVVARLTPNGLLDSTFGTNGIARPMLGSVWSAETVNIALQPDGKVLVVGSVTRGGEPTAAVARLDTTGKLDTSFGSSGISTVLIGSDTDGRATSAVLTANGQILVTGALLFDAGPNPSFVLRLNPNGSLDNNPSTGFGPNHTGVVTTTIGSTATANDLAVTSDGHIFTVGNGTVGGQTDTAVIRYTANGILDTSFNGTGILATDTSGQGDNDGASTLVVDSTGRLVISGTASTSPPTGTVLRLLASGARDTSFGTNGLLSGTFGDAGANNAGVTLDQAGRQVVVGASVTGSTTTLGIERLTTGASPYDSAFGSSATPGRETIACPNNGTGAATAVAPHLDAIIVGGNCSGSLVVYRLVVGSISNLQMTTTTPTVPAGHGVIPLSSIPSSVLSLDAVAMASSPTYASPGFGSPGFGSPGFGSPGFGSPGFGSPGFGSPGFGSPGFGSPGFGSLINSPFVSPALGSLPLSTIPLAPPTSWATVLAGTPYAGLPAQSVTLQQVLALSPQPAALPQLTVSQVNVNATPLRKVKIASLLLSTTPLATLPAPAGGWCSYLAGQPANCGSAGPNYLATVGPVDVELQGDDLGAYYRSTPIDLNGLTLQHSTLPAVPLNVMGLGLTSLGSVATAALASPAKFVSCTTAEMASPTCDTLVHAQSNGKIQPAPGATFGTLLADSPRVVGTILLTNVIAGLIPPQGLPIEKLPLDTIVANSPIPSTGAASYAIDFDLVCGTAAGLTVTAILPSGFQAVPGSVAMTVGGRPTPIVPPQNSGNSVTVVPATPVSCAGSQHANVTLQADPSSTLGPTTAGASVATAFDHASVTGQAPVQVVANFQPNSPTSPIPVVADTMYLGHIATAGQVDYFSLSPPAPGSFITVTLSHLPADYDLVMYGPPSPSLRAAPGFGSPGFGSPGFGSPGFGSPGFGSPGFGSPVTDLSSATTDGSVTPPDLLQDVPRVTTMAVRSVSIQRGTTDESVTTPVTDGDTTPFTFQVSGYNGANSPQPYVLRVSVSQPPPPLACQSRNYTGGGTVGTLPTMPLPADTQTVILANQKRLGDIYGPSQASSVMSKLNALAARDDVRGVVVPVDGDPSVASAYQAWDQAPCSVSNANAVVATINGVVDKLRAGLDNLRYVVVAGNDEVIPMGRVPDKTGSFNERSFAWANAFNGKDNAQSRAFALGYLLSDDPYGDLAPLSSLEGQVFVPQLAVGRLVETPADITAAVDQYIGANGVRTPSAGFVTGYDFLAPSATNVANSLSGRVATNSLINPTWTRQDVKNALGTAFHGFADLNAHADPTRALPAQEFFSGTQSDPIVVSDLPADLSGSVLMTIGCHAGLNVPDLFISSPTDPQAPRVLDWAQTVSHNGGLFQGNTGYGLGDTDVVSYSERVLSYFAQNLDGTMSVGQALMFAKQKYLNMGVASAFDAKAIQEAAFYGLPMYRLNINGKVGTTAASVIPPAPLPPTTPLLASTSTTFNTALTQVTAASGRGTYYTVGGQFPQVTPNQPIEPRAEIQLAPRTDGLIAHGAVIEQQSSADITPFNPVIDTPVADLSASNPEPAVTTSAFPSSLQSVTGTVTPAGRRDTLVLTPGQFFSDGSGTGAGTQRNYSNIQSTVYYSNSNNFTAPRIATVQATVASNTASFLVTTPDTNIVRAVIQVLVASSASVQSWQKVELVNAGGGSWVGTLPVPAGTTQVAQYNVQLLSSDGNVGISSNKGLNFSGGPGAPPFTYDAPPTIMVSTPQSGGVYSGAPGSPPISAQFNCAGVVAVISCTGPAIVDTSTPGTHTFTVTAQDAKGRTSTVTITYTVDNTAPAVTFTSTPPPMTNQANATFVFSASDPDDPASAITYSCILDGGVTYSCKSPQNLVALPDGQHTFTVQATDKAGNSGTSAYSWLIDATPPTTTAKQSPPPNAAGWNNAPVTVTLNASDTGTGVKQITYSLSGAQTGGATVAGSTASFNVSNEGVTTVTYQATDNAGNVETPKTFKVNIDKTPPTTTITGPLIGLTLGSETGTATDNLSGVASVTVTFQGLFGGTVTQTATAANGGCPGCLPGGTSVTWQVPLAGLGLGIYTVTAVATDFAGNTGPPTSGSLTISL